MISNVELEGVAGGEFLTDIKNDIEKYLPQANDNPSEPVTIVAIGSKVPGGWIEGQEHLRHMKEFIKNIL